MKHILAGMLVTALLSVSTALDLANAHGDTSLADFLTQQGAKPGTPAGIGT